MAMVKAMGNMPIENTIRTGMPMIKASTLAVLDGKIREIINPQPMIPRNISTKAVITHLVCCFWREL